MKLRPYQETAADFLYETDRAMVLAPVGAGKTAITLTALQDMVTDGHIKRVLVLAPKRVCEHVWPVEIRKWAPKLSLAVAIGTPAARLKALQSGSDVLVINYDNIQWLSEQAPGVDAVVFDELTKLKDPSGKRFKALDKLIKDINIRWGLTGSFTSNGLEDVFGQCKIVDQSLLGRSKGAFLQQYFFCANRDYQDWVPKPGSLDAVMERIRPSVFLLEPGEYKDTLPPLHIVPVACTMDLREYRKMKRDLMLDLGTATAVAANAAVVTGKLQQISAGFVYETTKTPIPDRPGKFKVVQTPHWLSTHKLDALSDLLDENQHDNTLIFYWFQEELDALKSRFPNAATLDEKGAVERWNAGRVPILLAHPASAGHGLNLQNGGCKIVFTTLPWSLELFEQAIGRLHRSGQRHDVWCYLLITEGTIDETIRDALKDKRKLSDIALEALK